jgi:glycosyltransferase involved in cell wall biosynthesis
LSDAAANGEPTIRCVSIVMPVFRDGERAIALVRALAGQVLPPGVACEVVVVDDGSGDGTADRIDAAVGDRITLHRFPANRGRAAARNAGAELARGEVIAFVDCDCLPADAQLIAAHLRGWTADTVASIGPVTGTGHGFWHHYQSDASRRRARQHAAGSAFSGSSQNLMVSRAALRACGGFDESYRTYGFEDRDLQVRLGRLGRIAWADAAVVRHMDELRLALVCRKMREAGGAASALFAARHPEAYRALGYAALDARLHPWLRWPGRVAGAVVPPLSRLEGVLECRLLPYALRYAFVKALSGGSFLAGTASTPP